MLAPAFHFTDETAGLRASVEELFADVERHRAAGRQVIASSSFQTQSLPLLHLLSFISPKVPVYFLDTGFHFPETLIFRDEVARILDLHVVTVESAIPKVAQRTADGSFFWTDDTERCCAVNKTAPMEPVLATADVWITGVRRDQGAVRGSFEREMPGAHNTVRLHPMLEWSKRDVWRWVTDYDLPRHPLELIGYNSIGCQPCTSAPDLDGDRSGRWSGQSKTECGLHTVLAASPTQ